jgi:hypothetical protein
MVATGVADRAPERISQLIYLDAFVRATERACSTCRFRKIATTRAKPRRRPATRCAFPRGRCRRTRVLPISRGRIRAAVMQPIAAFEQPVRLTGAVDQLAQDYIYCTKARQGDVFRQFADRAKSETGWEYREIDASHNPHITVPDALAAMLHELATV